ncbi:hypothetical protein LDL08_13080 [Nonomuraea glycinis]|uniref:Uncharacterized protein n=1 Tax=Nonomuraea glycinis TaxID=2047744 RepID=A0A918A0X3_9ACTN|nr:hypothetical protein [Nonomuraea glycinis]MCA2177115.1 hypothetical protein [Nonomuraea glycinis]GGP02643.1 hypothetical protein GCM10012278_10630 [Nonomuraea glycinis]
MTNSKNPPNWKIGMWPGIALGMGLGVTQHNLLLGIALSVCLGVALSYALAATRRSGEA